MTYMKTQKTYIKIILDVCIHRLEVSRLSAARAQNNDDLPLESWVLVSNTTLQLKESGLLEK